jgi:hypothetical protein
LLFFWASQLNSSFILKSKKRWKVV